MTPEQSALWTEFHKAGLDFDIKMAAKLAAYKLLKEEGK
jgi:hypothetical protein